MRIYSMEDSLTIPYLKRTLLSEVRSLFRRNGTVWKEPILDVLQEFRQSKIQAVLFGGTLRSLLVSRIADNRPGRPRDIDIVISGATLAQLEDRFSDILERRTRFGGLRLQQGDWQFDVWPVSETWAFKYDGNSGPADFATLPETTTFNLESIAVEAWPHGGGKRAIFSGNDQFFEGIIAKTIELNRADNPFPELTVVRALVMATELQFNIGPRLAKYIRDLSTTMNEDVVERVQRSHYGHTRLRSERLCELIETTARRSAEDPT